jgi:hypothetical protein
MKEVHSPFGNFYGDLDDRIGAPCRCPRRQRASQRQYKLVNTPDPLQKIKVRLPLCSFGTTHNTDVCC